MQSSQLLGDFGAGFSHQPGGGDKDVACTRTTERPNNQATHSLWRTLACILWLYYTYRQAHDSETLRIKVELEWVVLATARARYSIHCR